MREKAHFSKINITTSLILEPIPPQPRSSTSSDNRVPRIIRYPKIVLFDTQNVLHFFKIRIWVKK